jgi:hypothetical protein
MAKLGFLAVNCVDPGVGIAIIAKRRRIQALEISQNLPICFSLTGVDITAEYSP